MQSVDLSRIIPHSPSGSDDGREFDVSMDAHGHEREDGARQLSSSGRALINVLKSYIGSGIMGIP